MGAGGAGGGGRGGRALGPPRDRVPRAAARRHRAHRGAAHPWQGRPPVALDELRAEPLLLREQGSGTRAALESALVAAGTDIGAFRVVGEMGSTQAIKQAVKAGVGVSLVSRRAVEEECRAGSVWCLRVRDLTVTRAFYLATHRERSRSPLAEAFRAFVETEAS